MIVKFFMIFNYTPLYNGISFRFNARIFVAELLLRSAHANHLTYPGGPSQFFFRLYFQLSIFIF